jgi:hypothetical protein
MHVQFMQFSHARTITMHSKLPEPEVMKFGCLQQKGDF